MIRSSTIQSSQSTNVPSSRRPNNRGSMSPLARSRSSKTSTFLFLPTPLSTLLHLSYQLTVPSSPIQQNNPQKTQIPPPPPPPTRTHRRPLQLPTSLPLLPHPFPSFTSPFHLDFISTGLKWPYVSTCEYDADGTYAYGCAEVVVAWYYYYYWDDNNDGTVNPRWATRLKYARRRRCRSGPRIGDRNERDADRVIGRYVRRRSRSPWLRLRRGCGRRRGWRCTAWCRPERNGRECWT